MDEIRSNTLGGSAAGGEPFGEAVREVSFTAERDGVTVERLLRGRGLSRHLLTTLKAAPDGLTVDGAHVRTVDKLCAGAVLTVRVRECEPSENIVPTALPLDIVYEDADLMIVNKPAGMAVHPSQGNRTDTVANALAFLYGARGVPFVFRAIGRLDKNTSGLLALAKNPLSGCLLTERGEMHRAYLAVCVGELPETGTIDAPIGRVPGSALLREVRADGKRAVTHYERLCCQNGCSLARVWLETGRTHQIRVHFASIGHPLPGDFLYAPDYPGTGRHALHAYELTLRQPVTGEVLRFQTPLPDDLVALLGK